MDDNTGKLLEINKNRLDEEIVLQTRLYGANAQELADARRAAAAAKARLEVAKAEVFLDVRRHPDAYGFDKAPTVDEAKALVVINPGVRKSEQELIDADHLVDVLSGKSRTLDGRKHGIQDLVQLRLADYFSEPRVKGGDEAAERFRRQAAEHEALDGQRATAATIGRVAARKRPGQGPHAEDRRKVE